MEGLKKRRGEGILEVLVSRAVYGLRRAVAFCGRIGMAALEVIHYDVWAAADVGSSGNRAWVCI